MKDKEYDYINPNHYQEFDVQTITMMERIWGLEATATYCKLCAFKYKMRAGSKPNQPIEQDLKKAEWYLQRYRNLVSRLDQQSGVERSEIHEEYITYTNPDSILLGNPDSTYPMAAHCGHKGWYCDDCKERTGGCPNKPF